MSLFLKYQVIEAMNYRVWQKAIGNHLGTSFMLNKEMAITGNSGLERFMIATFILII